MAREALDGWGQGHPMGRSCRRRQDVDHRFCNTRRDARHGRMGTRCIRSKGPSGLNGPGLPNGVARARKTSRHVSLAGLQLTPSGSAFDVVERTAPTAICNSTSSSGKEATSAAGPLWRRQTLKQTRPVLPRKWLAASGKALRSAEFPADLSSEPRSSRTTRPGCHTPDAMGRLASAAEGSVWISSIARSRRILGNPNFTEIDGAEGLNFAGWAKKRRRCDDSRVGLSGCRGEFSRGLRRPEILTVGLDGWCGHGGRRNLDLIAVGRAILGDPQWVDQDQDRRHRGTEIIRSGPSLAELQSERTTPPEPGFRAFFF